MELTEAQKAKIRKAAFEIAKSTDDAAAMGVRRYMFEEYIDEVVKIITKNLEAA